VITFEPLHDDVPLPTRGTSGSAGYDLAAYLTGRTVKVWTDGKPGERAATRRDGRDGGDGDGGDDGRAALELAPGERALIPLGFKAQLPPGIEAQVRPRSGTSLKTGLVIANAPGTIDPDYAEEWGVPVRNAGATALVIRHGDRIAQVVFARFETLAIIPGVVRRTTERSGGFGSTG
jgi:dUTP pyrophosphatase